MRNADVRVAVSGETHEFSTERELVIDRNDLDRELARQAALAAWYGVLLERARAERAELEAELEELTYLVDQEIRASAEKKPTEDAIKAKTRTDPRVLLTGKKLRKIEHDERLLGHFVSAFSQRKDLLVALARSRHLEMSSPSPDEVERIKQNLLSRR